MSGADYKRQSRRPFYTAAAWTGLLLPFLAVAFFFAVDDPHNREQHWLFATLVTVFAFCLLCCMFSLAGVRSNGAWVILPPALLGIVINAILGLLALCVWMLSYGPRSP